MTVSSPSGTLGRPRRAAQSGKEGGLMPTLAASTSRSCVIVLNTDNTTRHTVSVQHAIRMLVREVAIVEEAQEGRKIGPYPWPIVLRLIRYVKTTFLYAQSPAWSK